MALLVDASVIPLGSLPRTVPLSRVTALLRAILREVTSVRLGIATAAILVGGTLLSILTTPDPLWWHLHFSRLGTFSVFSGHVFNGTLMATGAGVVLFGLRLRREMTVHAGTAVLSSRRSATVVPVLIVLVGIHLSFVGVIPQNTNEFLHDRASTGAVLCFFVILASSRWMLRGMHRCMRRATWQVGTAWAVSISLFVPGIINMALFELVGFALIFGWLLFFARNLGRVDAPEPAREAPALPARLLPSAPLHRVPATSPAAIAHHPIARRGRSASRPWSVRQARRLPVRRPVARQTDSEHPRADRTRAIRV